MNLIECQNVSRRYGPITALENINFKVQSSEVVGLIGRNGAGKSTLLKMFPPLIHPSSGTVRIFDVDPWDAEEQIRPRLGYLSDQDQHPKQVRGCDLFALCKAVYPTWDQDFVDTYVKRLAIPTTQQVAFLSKGQARQLSLLCAIGHRPELVIFDEPAGGLDPVVRRELLQVLIELLAEAGSTVLFASHQFADVSRLAQRLVIIDQGCILQDDSLKNILHAYCRVLIPNTVDTSACEGQTWLLAINRQLDGTELIVNWPIDEAQHQLSSILNVEALSISSIGLEDLFIYLTRDQHVA